MPIVADGQLNLAALQVDDIYVVIIPPQTPLIAGVPTDGLMLVGTASKGKPNTPYPVGDPSSLVRYLGNVNTDKYDVVTEAIGAMKQGANNIYCIRVTDGTDVAAFANIVDNASVPGANLVKFTASSSGIWGNGIVINIGVGTNNVATPASGTVTIAGTWLTDDTATATINGIGTTYTAVAGDSAVSIATALASAINANASVNKYAFASVLGAVITITAVTKGVLGNSITLTSAKVSSGGTATSSGAVLANGSATDQTFRVTIRTPYDVPEIFDNLGGTAGTGAGSAAANIIAAVNNGVTGIRGPSALVTAAIATSPGSGKLINQSVILASGTDGRAGVTTNVLLGVDGLNSTRSGMYAGRGLPIAQFGLAGMTDPTSFAAQINFAKDENILVVLGLAAFASATTAVTTKQLSAVDAYQAGVCKDFLYLNDTFNNVIRLVSPIGPTLGKIASLSPERNPGNKPINGYLGTERTGYAGPGGSFVPGIPYSNAEIALLESNGIMFMTQPAIGGDYLALRHGQNSSSDATRNGINYTKLTQFIAKSFQKSLGFAVNEVHTPSLRRRVTSAISQFLQSLADPGPGRNPMIGDVNGGPAYSVQCNEQNNPDNMVALGYMFVTVQVKYFATVRFFVVQIEAGQSVTVRVAEANPLSVAA